MNNNRKFEAFEWINLHAQSLINLFQRTRSSQGCSRRDDRIIPLGLRIQRFHGSATPPWKVHGRRREVRPIQRLKRTELCSCNREKRDLIYKDRKNKWQHRYRPSEFGAGFYLWAAQKRRREKSCEQLQAKMKRRTPLMKWLLNCEITKPESRLLGFWKVLRKCVNRVCFLGRDEDELEKYIKAGKWRAGGGRSRFIESGRVFGAEEYADVAWCDWVCLNVVQVVASWRLGGERERERLWESENPSPVKRVGFFRWCWILSWNLPL